MKKSISILLSFFSLTVFSQTTELSSYQRKTMNTERFARAVNTGSNHTLLILGSAWETSPELGDEIAVYDSNGNMVGSVAWVPEQEGHAGIAIWGDDETTPEKEGMIKGEKFTIVLFDKSEDEMFEVKIEEFKTGEDVYVKDGVTVVGQASIIKSLSQKLELFQNAPNPVQENTSISFYIPTKGKVKLYLSNSLGQEVMVLADTTYDKGTHSVQMNAKSLTAGVYFYKIEANNITLTKQMTLVK